MRDIVERLREEAGYSHEELDNEAADEIETLRAERTACVAEIKHLAAEIARLDPIKLPGLGGRP